jgi:5-methylcytosine-specific restriction endonuclease McrBC regulatory subunit McrC
MAQRREDKQMNLELAKKICEEVGAERKRWGRHAGSAGYREDEVLDALMTVHEEGLFDSKVDKDALTKANRTKGAAEARAKRYKNQLDDANTKIEMLTKALEDAENLPEIHKNNL